MATTYLRPYKTAADRTAQQTMRDRFDYALNPQKCGAISAYLCDPETADAEFLLSKAKYKALTGREQKRDNNVLYYQLRQAFPAGEVDAETALKISYDFAMRWTRGAHAFFVVSHIDRPHPHCHIYYNSTSLDCTRKFRDFLGSARAVRRLSDRICLENNLSIIERPKLHSKGQYKHYGQWAEAKTQPTFQEQLKAQIDACLAEKPQDFNDFLRMMEAAGFEVKHGRGGVISFRNPAAGQDRFTRLNANTLGAGYGPEDIRAIIEGRADLSRERVAASGLGLVIDIQARMRQGKGPGYSQWAKIHNLKMMAAALQYLQENGISDYEQLAVKAAEASDRFHTLEWQIKNVDVDLQKNTELRSAVVDYAKTRPVFEGYKAAKYSKKYLAEHEDDIKLHRAAQATFTRLLNGALLPKMEALKKEHGELSAEKRAAYKDYKEARQDMKNANTAKANIDALLEITGPVRAKQMER